MAPASGGECGIPTAIECASPDGPPAEFRTPVGENDDLLYVPIVHVRSRIGESQLVWQMTAA